MPLRPILLIPALLAFALLLAGPPPARAGHDLGQDCYVCHNIRGGQVWPASYSVYSGTPIGMSPYSRPITCDVCHPDYGGYFKATSESHHPVAVIAAATMSSDYDNGVVIRCKDCHNADSVTLSPDLDPDLSPLSYTLADARTATDGYPNHDVDSGGDLSGPNAVGPGDSPHLLSMLLSGGARTVSGSATYNRVPSSNPATDYAFCLSCHDGSANTARAVNVRQDYIDKGHYFKADHAGQGITAGDRIPCSDCHGSHSSATNARLFEPDNTTFVGTRPTGKAFSNPYAPTNAEYRAMCIACHDDYNAGNTGNGTPTVRTVEPSPRKYGIAGHAGTDTQSCKQCHNPHKTPGGGPDCLTCHTSGGAAGTSYAYIDALFKGVGPDADSRPTDSAPLAWSQHGGFNGSTPYFIYTSPYDTKASNDCVKCHGNRHNNTYKLIDADVGDSYAFDNTATSLKTATVANANAFCLTCHDGNGADGDVRIGNQVPQNVGATWATRGHGLSSGNYTVSGNSAANLKCIDCHEIHGSNHAKLLPADNTALGSFAMPAAKPGMTFRSGVDTINASALDFVNHTLPSSGDTYGTAGNPGGLNTGTRGYTGSVTTGLCDACHRYSAAPPAGTTSTYRKSHTHEGIAGQGSPASQMTFTKDCVECHNPHGGANSNVYMVSDNIVVTQAAISGSFPVTFTDNAMFDPSGTGTALCNVCHASSGQDSSLNVNHNFRSSSSPDHGEGTNCTSCHAHGKTDNAAVFGFPQAGCNSCHGNVTNGTNWPDNTAAGAAYPNRARSHVEHINAIYNANSAILPGSTATDKKNATCTWCHPGSPPPGHSTDGVSGAEQAEVVHMDTTGDGYSGPPAAGDYWSHAGSATATSGTAVYFKSMNGAADNDAWFTSTAMKTCSNVNCHAGNLTPNWVTKERYLTDTIAPVFEGGISGVVATDLAQGGAVAVTWNTATDPGPPPSSPPVMYTLYWATSAANVFTSPLGTMDNLAATSAAVTGLTNGTPYYFGVRAKDSASPANATNNSDTSAGVAPTGGPPAPTTTTYYLTKASGNVYTGTAENMPACGSTTTFAAAGTTATSIPPGKGLLGTGYACSASTNNYVSNSSPNNGGGTTFESFVGFYMPSAYTQATVVTGNAMGNNFGMRGSGGTEDVRIYLAAVNDSDGTVTATSSAFTLANIGTSLTTAQTPDLSGQSVTVSAGQRLMVVFHWSDTSTTPSTNDRITVDSYDGTLLNRISLTEGPPPDTTPPVWPGGVSGIAVSGTGSGDSLQVGWNTATDAQTPPVVYDLYRGSSAATVFTAPTKTWTGLGTTSIIDTGLVEGTTYYYGVRAKDSVTPTPTATTNTDTASGVPATGAPIWSGGSSGVAATDLAQSGAVSVTWNTATDGDFPPVMYTLYWATSAANVFTSPLGTMDNVAATSATVTGLSNGTTYYFGVRAKDSASPANATNNTDTASATPTAPPPPQATTTYYLTKASGDVWTGTAENMPACGSTTGSAFAAAGTTATSVPPGRGLLGTGYACTASTNNYVSNSSPNNGGGTTFESFVGFYRPSTYAVGGTVTGNATGNNFGMRGSGGTEDVRIYLAAVNDSNGSITATSSGLILANIGTSLATAQTPDLSGQSVTVSAGERLAVVFHWSDTSTFASTNDLITLDNYDGTLLNRISLTEPVLPPPDTTPPAWSGGVSGIAVSGTSSGDSLQVGWNTAADAATPPVTYDLYRGASAATVFTAPTKTWTGLGTTSIIDTGLVEGTTYYYGVRARDSVTPTPNATTNTDTASGVPATVTYPCTTCHGAPPNTGAHLKHATADTDYADCDNCHGDATYSVSPARGGGYTTSGPAGLHNNGTPGVYMRANGETNAAWNDLAAPNDTCSNVDCHFETTTPSWTTGSTSCTSCHQMPPTTMTGQVDHDAGLGVALAEFLGAHDQCQACHGKKEGAQHPNYAPGSHGDGLVRMNGPDATPGPAAGTEYDDSAGGCGYACHPNDANHQMGTSATRGVNYGDFGQGNCAFCHETGTYSAPVVAAAGAHAGNCSACHPLHQIRDATRQVLVPNNGGVGINYASHGGIFLGGSSTKSAGWAGSGPTEAEICWGCHDGIGVSEWGVNNNAQTGNISYNYGSLDASNWTSATWTSGTAAFGYKTGSVLSTHAATTSSGAGTTTRKGVDDLPTIRCTYCHDVHDRNVAPGDATSGQPYLRGSWRGNPYPEDGAPFPTATYPAYNSTSNYWGAVPRGGPTAGVQTGGFYIDQNSGNPVSGVWTPTQFGGLCDLCHGQTKNGALTPAEIDALNQYDAAGVGWVSGLNGHSNSVEGGTDNTAAARNIFAGRGGATNQTSTSASHPFMLFDGTSMPGDSSGGFRGVDSQYSLQPPMGARPMDGDGWSATQWNNLSGRTLDLRGTTVNANFHSFSCSKCHNPHASRLPALMITNCLDTKHNNWDNDKNNPDNPTTDAINQNRSLSNWSSAQNCHRLRGDDPSDANDAAAQDLPGNSGWNTVTPW